MEFYCHRLRSLPLLLSSSLSTLVSLLFSTFLFAQCPYCYESRENDKQGPELAVVIVVVGVAVTSFLVHICIPYALTWSVCTNGNTYNTTIKGRLCTSPLKRVSVHEAFLASNPLSISLGPRLSVAKHEAETSRVNDYGHRALP